MTPFGEIMKRVVEQTPGAVGGAFADSQGEMVDGFSSRYDPHDWAVITAHYGVVLSLLTSVLGIWHYGGPEYFVAQHTKLSLVIVSISKHYYALVAVSDPAQIQGAIASMCEAAGALQQEMA